MPPLRERREDVPLLGEHLLRRHGGGDVEVDKDAMRLLLDHDWPGNARELENEILRLLALGDPRISPADLSPRIQRRQPPCT